MEFLILDFEGYSNKHHCWPTEQYGTVAFSPIELGVSGGPS